MIFSVKNVVITTLTLILVAACANRPQPHGLGAGESLNIKPPSVQHVDLQLQSKAGATASGLALGAVGTAGGAAVGGAGGAIVGLGCGPLFIVCSPLFAAVGAVGVGAMGGAAGIGYGGKGWTSGNKGELFNARIEAGFDQASLQAQLAVLVSNDLGQHWTLDPSSENSVTVNVTSLRVEQLPNQQIRLNLDAEMTAVIHGRTESHEIHQRGRERHIDDWLSTDGATVQQELNAKLESLAHTVTQILSGSPYLS